MSMDNTKNWRLLSELAQETDKVDPIDWSELSVSEQEAFNLMAMHVAEMDNDDLTNRAIIVKLLVENFVLNLKLLGKK
jgi:hypothetical protein